MRAHFAVGVLLLALGNTGCDGLIRSVMVDAPNAGDVYGGEVGVLREAPWLSAGDHELFVEVGPPDAVLRAWVVEPDGRAASNGARGTVLVLHGWRNEMFWMRGIAGKLADAGYRAVLVDLRGQGGSTGDYISYGAVESEDLVQVIDELERLGLADGPIGAWGISMGGSTAIMLAGRDARVEAVVAVSPYTSMRQVVPGFVRVGLPIGGLLMSDDEINDQVDLAAEEAGFDPDDADALRAIRRTGAPVLILHGEWDALVPYRHGRALHEAAPDRSELVKLKMTGHVGAFFHGEVADRSLAWFGRHFAGAKP